jgi:glycosyltransferase involved in cell wall biosynthesis
MQEESMTPRVSVVIPCYNTEKYVEEAIESVLAQTYPDIEIIVVDDGSTDSSPALIKRFENRGVRYIHQQNAGVSAARNNGVDKASGSIISFLDADDWMYPANIAEKVKHLQAENADMAFSWIEVTDEFLVKKFISKGADPKNFRDEVFNFTPAPVQSPSSAIVRKSALLAAGLFDTHLSTSADLDLWIRVSFAHAVARVETPLVKYRLVPGSMNTNITRQIRDMSYIFNKYGKERNLRRKVNRLKKGFYYSVIGNSFYTKRPGRMIAYGFKYLGVLFS